MAYQARLTTLGEIASALAHQLNQPLTAVMGYNAGLQQLLGQGEGLNPKVMAALQNQQVQASEAGRIVQRIREFLTRRAPKREQCDIALIARRAVELLQRELEQRKIKVEWALAEQIPPVYADAILVEQVLLNLVRNAADSLSGLTHAKRIGIAIHAAGLQFVRIDVQDNGTGLDGRTVEQLTAPFYSTKPDGMGMGLAICRSVIEVHHGSMDAGTGSLGGARFSFTLPIFVHHE
jgi:two-component system sensor histidine kinase DctS